MISDLEGADEGSVIESDVCIVGAGAAGISIALKLAALGKTVTLCEAGGFEYSEISQEVYQGEVRGDPYFDLEIARLRYLGGTTNHWAGDCRTFDSIDFDRSFISEELKWPISKTDLDPFLDEACGILDIDPVFYDSDYVAGIKSVNYKVSPPTRFGEKYRAALQASDTIGLMLNANIVDVVVNDRNISAAIFKSYNGKELTVRADKFVLATGGIENSRILLWLHQNQGDALYDGALPVGNYWMEHLEYILGEALVDSDIVERNAFVLADETQREEKILNCVLRTIGVPKSTTKQLVTDLLCVAPSIGEKMAGLVGKNLACGAIFEVSCEQLPVRSNRITLSRTEKDKFGKPRPVLYWKKSPLEKRTVAAAARAFNKWLIDQDHGRLRLDGWVLDDRPFPEPEDLGEYHHMGGTRMGESTETSVVDLNCRVHDTDNLYIAGSSVFATGGYSNPTLPIVQLSLRLANHIAQS
ncbi:FAD-dependent oxidoreductase [Sneathiella sp.]|uniref:FAD-dependent oxidoreductase n=1 Tax=Sneathiella sp. TaxID=1964365 RepID=UPI0026185AAD|nr:GMC family oxidoreductase [Sneathiella sp.]MDF2369027.1 GMC family oxidoreductase [Sneathiella sp.]